MIAFMASAASLNISGITCEQVFILRLMLTWPSISITVLAGIFFASKKLPHECRKSWKAHLSARLEESVFTKITPCRSSIKSLAVGDPAIEFW